nr:hypothetical protein CFP56_12292 [Quercus suber]
MCKDGMRTDEKKPRYPRKRASTRPVQSRRHQGAARSEGDDPSMPAKPGMGDMAGIMSAPRYKFDLCESAFFGSIVHDQDHFSPLPTEVLYNIFDYCVLDHHPERARMEHSLDSDFQANPHVLVSLAAMSRHFRGLVEDFSRRFLTKHHTFYSSSLEVDIVEQGQRRSARIAARGVSSDRVYRMELVTAIRERCIQCGKMSDHYAIMFNGVACHPECELRAFPGRLMVGSPPRHLLALLNQARRI